MIPLKNTSKNTKLLLITISLIAIAVGLSAFAYIQYMRIGYVPEVPVLNPDTGEKVEQISTPKNFKVAFTADQGYSDNTRAVLKLIKSEHADMLLLQGDFDYINEPEKWMIMHDEELGSDFPIFASVGNHDTAGLPRYKQLLLQRLNTIPNETCTGTITTKMHCIYKGLEFVNIGVGTVEGDYDEYITENLNNSKYIWKICSWHKNQHKMQAGGKPDEVGWEVYEDCRKAGAVIATGHEHSYSRTYLLSDFEKQVVVGKDSEMEIKPGQTFAFVSGLGGHSIREQNSEVPAQGWWGSVYTATQGAKPGALFCEFNTTAQNKAHCYFKNIDGQIIDEFTLTSGI